MKKPKQQKPASIGGYSRKMDKAIKLLSVAQTFAEDGAQFDAVMRASEAISLLLSAHIQREAYSQYLEACETSSAPARRTAAAQAEG